MLFKEFSLHPEIIKAVEELGYVTPTPVQSKAMPEILKGSDVLASAETGTGKTAAFLLPTFNRLLNPSAPTQGPRGPRALILVPTRELALQVAAEAGKYSKYLTKMSTVCICGGIPYPIQNKMLSRPYEILVATPGRLIDQLERGRINLSRVEVLILDEADRMLDMGFIGAVEEIAAATPKSRQTLMFSATLKGKVLSFSKDLLRNPVEIRAEQELTKQVNVEQRVHYVDNLPHKYRLLEEILTNPEISQTIIFTATKSHADELVERLREIGHDAAGLHGDMSQRQRTRTIDRMHKGATRILVATDVAARGIHVQTISHVINFDLPMNLEDYVHRIGRTGRAGAKGIALSFASNREADFVRKLEQFTKQKIAIHVIPGFEPSFTPRTHENARPSGGSHGGFRNRSHFSRDSREGGFGGRPRREGGGGFGRSRKEDGFDRSRQEGGFGRPKQDSAFGRKRSAGMAPRRSSANHSPYAR